MGTVPPLIISAVTGTLSVPSWDDAGLLVGIGVLSVMQQSGNSLALKVKEFADPNKSGCKSTVQDEIKSRGGPIPQNQEL